MNLRDRQLILRRDGFKCQLCGAMAPMAKLHIDHKTPLSKGGEDNIANAWVLCEDCNIGKSNAFNDGGRSYNTLIGLWFHSYKGNEVEWQGHVLDYAVDAQMFFVQLFDWIDGAPSRKCLVAPSQMTEWAFYDTNKGMIEAYEEYNRYRNPAPLYSVKKQ